MITKKRLLNFMSALYEQDKGFYNLASSFVILASNNEEKYKNKEYKLSDLQEIIKNMSKDETDKFDKLFFDYLLDFNSSNSNYSELEKLNPEMKLSLAEFYEVFGLKPDNNTIEERLEKFYEKEFYKVEEKTFISSFYLLSNLIYNRLSYNNKSSNFSEIYKKQIENMFKNGLIMLDKKAENNPEIKNKIYKILATDFKYNSYSRLEKIIIPIMKEREDFKKYIR